MAFVGILTEIMGIYKTKKSQVCEINAIEEKKYKILVWYYNNRIYCGWHSIFNYNYKKDYLETKHSSTGSWKYLASIKLS